MVLSQAVRLVSDFDDRDSARQVRIDTCCGKYVSASLLIDGELYIGGGSSGHAHQEGYGIGPTQWLWLCVFQTVHMDLKKCRRKERKSWTAERRRI